jgi:hypothetical protein
VIKRQRVAQLADDLLRRDVLAGELRVPTEAHRPRASDRGVPDVDSHGTRLRSGARVARNPPRAVPFVEPLEADGLIAGLETEKLSSCPRSAHAQRRMRAANRTRPSSSSKLPRNVIGLASSRSEPSPPPGAVATGCYGASRQLPARRDASAQPLLARVLRERHRSIDTVHEFAVRQRDEQREHEPQVHEQQHPHRGLMTQRE